MRSVWPVKSRTMRLREPGRECSLNARDVSGSDSKGVRSAPRALASLGGRRPAAAISCSGIDEAEDGDAAPPGAGGGADSPEQA